MKKIIYIVAGIAIIALIAFVLTKNKNKNEAETAIVSQKNSNLVAILDWDDPKGAARYVAQQLRP